MDGNCNTNQYPVNTDDIYLYQLIRRSLPADHPFFNFCFIRSLNTIAPGAQLKSINAIRRME